MLQGSKLSAVFSDRRTLKWALIIGGVAIALIFLSSVADLFPSDNSKVIERYAAQTESRLLDILSEIDGVGEAKIFLTIDNSGENVYLKNSDKKTVSIEPRVRGVVIVCEGGDDPIVASRVLEAVTKALSLNSDKVCITK